MPRKFLLMKRLCILLFCLPFIAFAQNKPLVIQGVAPNLYVNHTVAPKENYYSIGRIYNISPKEIAPFNNLVLENGLTLNQTIKIPLTATNFSQDGQTQADEVLIPLHHTVVEKEGLYRIGVNYNKVPLETLKQWNNIKGESVSNGTSLVVGYLKVKKELSPLAGMAKAVPVTKEPAMVTAPPKPMRDDKPIAVKEPVKEPVKEVVVKEPVKEKPVAVEAPVKRDPEPVVTKEPEKTYSTKNFKGGIFKSDFEKQSKSSSDENGTAATFKSTSGWEDGKYYCLHNSATAGTIIKITSNTTGKSIYAKVLDVIPDIKQNNGLLLRISNAAAEELGVGETKFDCSVAYSK